MARRLTPPSRPVIHLRKQWAHRPKQRPQQASESREETMEKAEIGLIGLGTMGSNLALNIAEHGHRIAVFNRTRSRTDAFVESAGGLKDMVVPCYSLEELAAAIRPPRPIIIMVLAGKPVDEQIAALRGVLSDNDIVIDAGNANFRDTM